MGIFFFYWNGSFGFNELGYDSAHSENSSFSFRWVGYDSAYCCTFENFQHVREGFMWAGRFNISMNWNGFLRNFVLLKNHQHALTYIHWVKCKIIIIDGIEQKLKTTWHNAG